MKLPKIVLKKNAMRARKAEQLGALERQPGKTDTPSPLSKSSPHARQQQQQHQPLSSSSHSPRANTAHTTTTNGRMSSSSAHSPRARHPASPRAGLSRCSTSSSMLDNDSAASSEYGRDESFSTSTGGSSHSDNRSSGSSGSSASSQASSRRSFSQSMSEAQLGKAPTTEVASKPPRTQYSAYARKMKTAKRQRGMLPRTSSAVDFDDADEFFDKSDSSLGGGNSPSFTPATDTARGGRGRRQNSKYAGDAYDEDLRDEESDEEEESDEVRQPYRSGIPTGRRMTQKEILQRRLLREKEEAVLAARQAKAERHTSRPATSSPRKGQTMVGDADGANTVTSRLARAATMNAPALTATSSTAPMPSSSEGRSSTSKGNNNNNNNNNASDKKPMGLLGWRRKLLPTALKNSRSVTPSSKEDASSPSNSRSGMTISGSRTSLSASSPTASQRHGGASAVVAAAVETQSPRDDRASGSHRSGSNTRRGSALPSPAGSPKAAGKTATTLTATARGKSTLSATAATAPAVAPNAGAATASASTTASPPLDVHQPISKETLRRLNNQQLSRLDFNAQKARKMSRSERNAAEASGLLGVGSNPSLLSNGGYGSFLDGLPFTEEDDGGDTRSNGSRRSNNSRSSDRHRRHRHEAQQQQQQHQHGAASAAAASARPKPPTRTSSFFRGLFRSSSGASKENYTHIDTTPSATPPTEKRTRPTTADVGTLKREKALAELAHLSRQSLARSSESPSSEVSGAGATSLYNMESDLSSTISSTNSTQNTNGCSSGTLTYRGEQILKRKRGNLPGAHGRNGRLLSGGGGSDDLARSHADHELNDSFGSLFKTDGHAVALYGSRNTTPSEFGSAPTPSGGTLEVAMAAIAKRSVVGGEASALPPPQSHTSQPASLFPHNSYPRAMAAAAVPTPAGNSHAAAPSFNAFGAVWHPQQQNLLGQLEAPALGATTNINGAVAMRLATPVALAGQSPTPPMPPAVAAAAAAAAAATLPTGSNASPGTEGMTGAPSAEAEEMRRNVPDKRAESVITVSPTPAFDDFAAAGVVGGAAPCKSVSPPRSLDGEGRSRGGHRRRHRSRRSDHADGSAVTSDTNASRASRQDVQRKSSQLSVTEGFRVRGRGNASGETSKDGADDGTLRAKTTSGGSRTEKGATAHPPPGAPSSSDPRRSENGRHGGSAAAAATTDNSLLEGNPENSRSATITMKPARHNSASLPPQPPTLSNTETRNYRGRFATSGSGGASSSSAAAAAAAAGTSLSAAIAPLQGSDVALPTRADSKDFLLRHDHDTRPAAASATTAAAPRLSHHESSSRRHRTQRSSNASSRHDSSFSFSSESLLDGKARGRLAKAAAASNAASNSVERRRGGSNTTNGEGEGNMTSKRQHARDQNSTSLRASQHFRKSDLSPHQLHNTNGHAKANVNADGDEDRHHHHRHHRGSGTRRSSDVEMCESSGSQRRRRSRGDLYGSSRRPSSASVSLVAGLDEVLPHRPMHLRNASTSTTGSLSAAPSSRNSSVSSGERRDDAVGRNSVRYLKKMAAKARDVSASSSCDLDARAASTTSNKSDSAFHAHSKAMAQMSDQNTSKIAAAGSSAQLTRMQQSTGSAAARHHHGSAAPRSGSATRITSNANAAAYAMKLPSFKPNAMVESSSSNDVSTDRPANSGGSRPHASSNHHHHHHGGDAAAVQLQRMPLTMSNEGGAGPHKGSGNYLLQPTRPVGTSGNGRLSYATNATSIGNTNNNTDGTGGNGVGGYPLGTEKDAGVVGGNLKRVQSNANSGSSGGDRVTSSAEGRKSWGNAMAGSTGGKGGVTLPPATGQYSLSSAVGVESNTETLGATTPFIGEGGVRSSVPTALLAQPRDGSAKRRRPTTENFTPWSVDMSRFTKLQQEETTEPPST